MSQRVVARFLDWTNRRSAGSAYDQLVKDKDHLPKKLSQRYVKELKRRIGRGTEIDVVKSETTMPRQWDYGNYTVLKITLPNGKSLNGAITLNVADNEASGNFTVDYDYGGVIGLGRASTAERAITMMLSDAGDRLKGAGEKQP
jgi:hypothetical protein